MTVKVTAARTMLMALKKGYYSLCQYTWPLGRREPVTVGVLLICPDEDFKEARFLDAFGHLRWRLGEPFEEQHVESLVQTVRAWIDREPVNTSVEAWDAFARRLGNELEMTPLRAVRFRKPAEGLQRLFDEMVAPPPATFFQPRLVPFRVQAHAPGGEQDEIAQTVRRIWPSATMETLPNGELRVHKNAHGHTELPLDPTACLQLVPTGPGQWVCAAFASNAPDIGQLLDALSSLERRHPVFTSTIQFSPRPQGETHAQP